MKARPVVHEELNSTQVAQAVAELLNDKKAEDIVILDIKSKASFADYMVIASGNVSRQVVAMADYVARFGKDHHLSPVIEGTELGDWVLVDLGDVVVHLFRPEVRERYSLEKMWST